jgi:hypothetical protein
MEIWDKSGTGTRLSFLKKNKAYSGIKGTRIAEMAAKPYCAQKTARYAQRESRSPVQLMMRATQRGPKVYAKAERHVSMPRRGVGAIWRRRHEYFASDQRARITSLTSPM